MKMTEKQFDERLPHYVVWGYGNQKVENKYGNIVLKTNNQRNLVNGIKLGRKKGYTKFTISKHGFNPLKEFNDMCNAFKGERVKDDMVYINEKNQKVSYDDWKGNGVY